MELQSLINAFLSESHSSATELAMEGIHSHAQRTAIVDVDPTKNKKHVSWIAKQVNKGNINLPQDSTRIRKLLLRFERASSGGKLSQKERSSSLYTPISMAKKLDSRAKNDESLENLSQMPGVEVLYEPPGVSSSWYVVSISNTTTCLQVLAEHGFGLYTSKIIDRMLKNGPIIVFGKDKMICLVAHIAHGYLSGRYGESLNEIPQPPLDVLKASGILTFGGDFRALMPSSEKMSLNEVLSINDPHLTCEWCKANNSIPSVLIPVLTRVPQASFACCDLIEQIPEKDKSALLECIASCHTTALQYAIEKSCAFPMGESAIASNGDSTFLYAVNVLGGKRFLLGETTLAQEASSRSVQYAKIILKGAYPEKHDHIALMERCREYADFINSLDGN